MVDQNGVVQVDARPVERFDAVVVGAGFAGLYMLHTLRAQGLAVRVVEAGSDVGGTWFWNRYPGARCDVESVQYSYSFSEELQQEWQWSERFAAQPEILRYLNHVADRFDLRRDIAFDTRVETATYDEAANRWLVETDRGDRLEAIYCIMATGCLSAARLPAIDGIEDFDGPILHTGNWPHEPVDLAGKRVGVIGTGSSGIQAIPALAREVGELFVFQRTPNFTVPARNAALDPATVADVKSRYAALRAHARTLKSGTIYDFGQRSAIETPAEERESEYRARWEKGGANFMHAFNDLAVNLGSNETAAEFVRARILETVKDPETAKALLPFDHPIGTKRICVDSDYYETYNRANVHLVDLRADPLVGLTADGVRTQGATHDLEIIVFATGFDALTGSLLRIDIRGRDGLSLRDKWEHGPRSYLGLMVAGFPNLFTITGPGSPSVLSNVVVSIEQHVEWLGRCIAYMRREGIERIEPEPDAEDEWVDHVNEVAEKTLYTRAASWYMGANIPGKPRVFLPYIGGVGNYRIRCDAVAANGYEGFALAAAEQA